ncbi:MAG: hypothetical protein J6Y74_01215 [Clostridia bacterium]|nr:hypothetical protein [Clostridia bacterium]
MKKKFGIIVAILLCVALLMLTLVACKTKDDGKTLKGVNQDLIEEVDSRINTVIDKWLKNNASDVKADRSVKLSEALNDDIQDFYLQDNKKNDIKPTISVSYNKDTGDAGAYKVIFVWTKDKKNKLTKIYQKDAIPAKYAEWAGSYKDGSYNDITLDDIMDNDEKISVLDDIINAALKMTNNTVSDAVSGKFGVQGKVGVEVMGHDYLLDVKGNIDLADKVWTKKAADSQEMVKNENKTNFSVLVKNGETNKELAGLYFQNALEDKDCKLYVSYVVEKDGKESTEYKYIDYAILNELIDKLDGKFRDDKGDIITANGFAGLLTAFKLDKNIADMAGELVGDMVEAYTGEDGENTINVIDINFGTVLSEVTETYGSVINAVLGKYLEKVPVILGVDPKKIDFETVHGLIGHITITAISDKKGNMTDFELAVNIPECTLYFAEDETAADGKLEIPAISFAIYAHDFAFSDDLYGKVKLDTPKDIDTKAEYFSPTNFNVGGDVTVTDKTTNLDSTFRYHLVTSINPFKPSQIKASFTIKQSQGKVFKENDNTNFFSISYDQATKTIATSGTAYDKGDDGETIYTFTADQTVLATIMEWAGLDENNWHGLVWNNAAGIIEVVNPAKFNDQLKALFGEDGNNVVAQLLAYYIERKTPTTASAEEESVTNGTDAKANESNSSFDIQAVFSGVGGLFDKLKSKATVGEGSFGIKITGTDLNEYASDISKIINRDFIAFLNRKIPGANIPADLKDYISNIELYVNTDGYKNKLFFTLTFKGDVYKFTFDVTEKAQNRYAMNYELTLASSGRYVTFDLAFDAKAGTIAANYVKKASKTATETLEETGVTHSNFSFNWGAENASALEMLDPTAAGATTELVFGADGAGIATQLIGGLTDFLDNDLVRPIVKSLGRVIIRNAVKKA